MRGSRHRNHVARWTMKGELERFPPRSRREAFLLPPRKRHGAAVLEAIGVSAAKGKPDHDSERRHDSA